MRKFMEANDELYALLNWHDRHNENDTAILKCLSPGEVATYRQHKDDGLSDTDIFRRMFPEPPARTPTKFSTFEGKLFAIMNWNDRRSDNDVAAIRYLDSDETRTYHELHNEGLSDTLIFKRMFPERVAPPPESAHVIQIDLSELTKHHLARLIEAKLNATMPSLHRASRVDLEKLLRKLYKSKTP